MNPSISSSTSASASFFSTPQPQQKPEVSGTLASNTSIFETAGSVAFSSPAPATSSFCVSA